MISMRRLRRVFGVTMALMFILGFIASAPPWAHAAVPQYINYQGKLTDADDNPVTGDVSITLRIYDAESGGTALWTETQTATVTRGIFSVLLGATEDLDDLDFDDAYWYSVEIESDGEMTPRQRLTAVAYAINADKLDGYDASDFLAIDTSEGSTTGITVEGGLITAGANEDIELNPTGTGNVIITIDSTSGDFKVTDGTTNFVLVDNDTGNVTVANDLTVSGIIYGVLASTGGDSTFSSITVTGTSDLQGNISDSGGVLTIADALTQTGESNQVTFAGNVDANNGVDVTGALTVSGATTLSSALDMNANIDLDYSGTSAALSVAQASTGAAAQFTGAKVLIGADTSNANAVSAGELYVQGDLEVDGTIYGDVNSSGSTTLGSTTLSSLTVTGTSDLQGNVSDSAGDFTIADNLAVTGTADLQGNVSDSAGTYTIADDIDITPTALTSSGTDDYALSIAQTLNDTGAAGGSDTYRGIKLNLTETDKTGWDNVYLMDLQVGGTSEFLIADSGNITAGGTLNMSSNKITNLATPTADTDAATKAYADGIEPSVGGGWSEIGSAVYVTETGDNVGIGTTSPGSYKLNVSGATNTTSLYINGALIDSGDLSDTASLAMLGQDETITGNWVNTANPWADNEVVDALTVSGGTIENTVIGATTPAAATVTNLTFDNTGSATVMTFEDNDVNNEPDTLVYDSTADRELYFSGSMSAVDFHVRGSSPAVLSFGTDASGTSLIYDPATDEIRFSRGTFAQDFRNVVKNGSFESFSAMQAFHDYDPNYATTSDFGGTWDTAAGFQGGWENFAPDDWDYVSGDVFQHAPVFFEQNFNMEHIDADSYKEDFTEGQSAVRLAAIDGNATPGKISQVISGLKPSAIYSVGVKARVEFTVDGEGNKTPTGIAKIDIEGEDGGNIDPADNASTTLSTVFGDDDKIIEALSVAGFPPFGIIVVEDEHIRYEGLDDATTPQRFLKCTRATNSTTAVAHNTTGVSITLAPFQTITDSAAVDFTKFEGQFATDSKASDITLVLSAEAGAAYFDTVQVVAGGTVPEYTPNTLVDTGDQTVYGSLRIGRASDDKGGILSVDKFVRTRGLELFTDDPGLTGATGGGGIAMGGGGVFPPGPGWNPTTQQSPSIYLYVTGTYASSAPPWRDYKIVIDGTDPVTYEWFYQDETTGWIMQSGGAGITAPTAPTFLSNDETASAGVQIEFSATEGAAVDDEWWFNASNENQFTGDSYAETADYIPGKTRIYVDPDPFSPYHNQLVFEDSGTKVSLSELAGSVNTQASFTSPSPVGGNSGNLFLDVYGSYTGSEDRTYRAKITAQGDPNGAPATSDSFQWTNGSTDIDGYLIWSGSTEIVEGTQHYLDEGIYVSFGENYYTADGYINGGSIGDEWSFNANTAGTATVAVHTHTGETTGGELAAVGTTATDFSIGKDTDAAANDISLKFGSPTSEKIIKWDKTNATFDVGSHMKINGTLTATTIAGVAADSHTHAAADLPATVSYLSNTIESAEITNETIINEDIATDAAIGWSKISKTGAVASDVGAEPTLTKGDLTEATSSVLTIGSGTGAVIGSGTTIQVKEASAVQAGYLNSTDWTTFNNKVSVEADPLALLTAGTDNVKDTHIDWGIGAGQVSTDDMTEGSTNLYYTDARVDTRLDTNQTIGGTATWTFSNQVTIPQTPSAATDAASKSYVDTGIAGLSWKEAVKDLIVDNTLVPPTEVSGDRYVLDKDGGIPHANWDGAEAGDMVDFNGTSWVEEDPQDGDAVFVEDVDTGYVYTGTAWTPFTGASAYVWGTGLSNAGTTVNANLLAADLAVDGNDDIYVVDLGIDHDATTNFVAAEHIDWTNTSDNLATSGAGSFLGNVGIGTSAPEARLHIGDATNKILISSAGAMTFAGTGDIDLPADSVDTTDVNFDYVASVATSSPLSGGAVGSEGTAISLSIADAAADGSTKGAATFTAADFNATSGDISIDYANAQAASGAAKGFLTSANWTTFNNKQDALTFSTGLTNTGGTITTNDSQIVHDSLSGFVANEHIDWTSASSNLATTGTGAFTPAAITSAGTDDKLISLTQTLNDASAAAETQTYTGVKFVLTSTDLTGWDAVNLMDLHAGAAPASKFKVDDSGNLTLAGDATISGGTIDLGVGDHDDLTATDITDLTDGNETTLHIHTGNAPGAHATTHHTGGSDQVYWSSLDRSDGVTTTISSEIDTDISTHADLTATHGATGAVVGTTNTQTLTNKTFSDGVNLATVSGNVGIGTTAPAEVLDVNGDIIADHIISRGGSPATIQFGTGAGARSLEFDATSGEFSFTGGKLQQQFQNLIRNGSFEGSQPTGWYSFNGGIQTLDTVQYKFGVKSLKIGDNSTSAEGAAFYFYDTTRLQGERLTLSFWAKTGSGTATASAGFSDSSSDSTADTGEVSNILLDTTWRQFTMSYPDNAANNIDTAANQVVIYLFASAGSASTSGDPGDVITGGNVAPSTQTGGDGYVYIDGVTLVQGNLALDYGPSPIFDTGPQVIYGNLAIGAHASTYSTSTSAQLIFGEPDDSFGTGYGTWNMGTGSISFEQWGDDYGRFFFNRGIRIYPTGDSGGTRGSSIHLMGYPRDSGTYGSSEPMFQVGYDALYNAAADGTYIGINSCGTAADYIHFQRYDNTKFKVDWEGNVTATSISTTGGSSAFTGTSSETFTIDQGSAGGTQNVALQFSDDGTDNAHYLMWDDSDSRFEFNNALDVTGNLSATGNIDVDGTITAGSGSNVITTAAGLLDATKLSGTIAAGRLPADGYGTTYVNDTGDTMTGELTLTHTGTANNTQILDINSTGIMAGSASKTIASISDSAAHTTTENIKGLEIAMAGAYNNVSADPTALAIDLSGITGTSGTEKGIDIQMGATTDDAINTNAQITAGTLTDGTASITGGNITGVTGITTGTVTATSIDVGGGYAGTAGGGVTLESDGDIYFDGNMYQTGSIYTVDTVRFTGNNDVALVSKFGVGATGTDTDYLQIDIDGHLSDADDPVTIADALSQTGSSNQVTFAGNVDADNGLDVTGNITVTGTVDTVDIAALKTAADLDYDDITDLPTAAVTDGATTTIATGDQIYDFVIDEGYSTASDALTGLVQSTTAGTNYFTGGKLGIGISVPTADLTVKGDLSTALTGTVSVTAATTAVTGTTTLFDTELAVGDAIKIGSEIFTISAIGSATSLTLDSNHTAGASGVTAYKDSDLLSVKDGNDVALMTLDKSGDLTVEGTINATVEGTSSNANLLDNIDSSAFLRSDVGDSVTTGVTLNIDTGATLSIDGTLDLGGTAIIPDAAEINILDGGLSAAELDGSLLTATEGDTAYVNVGGDTMTGNLIMTSADISVDAGQKINVEGAAGDSYMKYNSTTGRLEIYVGGEVVAYMQN